MNAQDETMLIDRAAQALRGHGLAVTIRHRPEASDPGRSATWLCVSKDRQAIDYAVEVKCRLTSGTLGAVVMQLRRPADAGEPAPLLITDHVAPQLADQLRQHGQQFADAAGNAYLEGGALLVYVSGRKLRETQNALRASKGFPVTRLKVLFALICDPELAAAPYRAIAAAADVALGAMPAVVAELQQDGSLIVIDRQRRLNAGKRLLDEWAQAYALGLRGRTLSGRYLAQKFDDWREWSLNPAHARWGGEPAAALLACDLEPGMLTIYGDRLPPRLITDGQLEVALPVAYEHLVELRRPFWGEARPGSGRPDVVPPALVYADLLATGNTRCIEAAQALYDSLLARRFPVASATPKERLACFTRV